MKFNKIYQEVIEDAFNSTPELNLSDTNTLREDEVKFDIKVTDNISYNLIIYDSDVKWQDMMLSQEESTKTFEHTGGASKYKYGNIYRYTDTDSLNIEDIPKLPVYTVEFSSKTNETQSKRLMMQPEMIIDKYGAYNWISVLTNASETSNILMSTQHWKDFLSVLNPAEKKYVLNDIDYSKYNTAPPDENTAPQNSAWNRDELYSGLRNLWQKSLRSSTDTRVLDIVKALYRTPSGGGQIKEFLNSYIKIMLNNSYGHYKNILKGKELFILIAGVVSGMKQHWKANKDISPVYNFDATSEDDNRVSSYAMLCKRFAKELPGYDYTITPVIEDVGDNEYMLVSVDFTIHPVLSKAVNK